MLSQPWQRNASSAAQYHRALTFRQLSHARAVLAPKALASFISLVIELVFWLQRQVQMEWLPTRDHNNVEEGERGGSVCV